MLGILALLFLALVAHMLGFLGESVTTGVARDARPHSASISFAESPARYLVKIAGPLLVLGIFAAGLIQRLRPGDTEPD